MKLGLAECGKWCSRGRIAEGLKKIFGGTKGGVGRGKLGHGAVVGNKLYRFGDTFSGSFGDVYPIATIVLGRCAKVPAVNAMRRPGATVGGGFMHKNSSAWGC